MINFMFSDLHGIDPSLVLKDLKQAGYDINNPLHRIISAGDLVDGLEHDEDLVATMEKFPRGKFIRGNHAFGPEDAHWYHIFPIKDSLAEKEIEFIEHQPLDITFTKFVVAHGIYLPSEFEHFEDVSVWASPIMLPLDYKSGAWKYYAQSKEWKMLDEAKVQKVLDMYEGSLDVYAASIGKPLFLGHFPEEALLRYAKLSNIQLTKNSQGFYQYKNIVWLDTGVRTTTKMKIFVYDDSKPLPEQ